MLREAFSFVQAILDKIPIDDLIDEEHKNASSRQQDIIGVCIPNEDGGHQHQRMQNEKNSMEPHFFGCAKLAMYPFILSYTDGGHHHQTVIDNFINK